ncbi:carbonic anhydrases/acetyltransferase, isoleucine patch superfamily [Luminiphilus syltensis NOR5-1B]|uniref:Carbonic anhydrases/acetyltransferase, isoleucine patch superfamily n=1 Tax=Luminiphilus syltensis NOR5-1B TaxID=565045 RepID=B8KXC5_9GAMM|nr:gamma carbonic anhydrase family protein [Luminiphilus syltensis]EED35974.1 carbonic anhydrases/acetyltransferase, isoleucine patch superfamily [Luminiphilus syltensis NOR5-1B]
MKYALGNKRVVCEGSGHFIAPNAAVIGDVCLKPQSSVWFSAVIRGDDEYIEIGEGSNIQDGAVVHADAGQPCIVGDNVVVGHNAMLHGCDIGAGSLIGINAVVLDGARLGRGCLIAANALVTSGTEIPDGSMVMGSPAKVTRSLSEKQQAMLLEGAKHYVINAAAFSETLEEMDD